MLTVKVEKASIDRANSHRGHGDDKACLWIRRLYSGLPHDIRESRYLVVLQSWFDDSGRGQDPVFVLAGYAGPLNDWCAFADEYQQVMETEPKLAYLKGVEANSLTGHFAGWMKEKRDQKLCDLIAVIRNHSGLVALSFGVDSRAFNKILREPRGIMKSPDAIAYAHVVTWLLHSAYVKKPPEQIELIFDQGTLSRERQIRESYEGMMERLPKRATDLLVNRPRFEDDKCNLPLQAAALLAWHSRRDYEEQMLRKRRWKARVWDELRTVPGKSLFLGTKELSEFKAQRWKLFGR